MIERYNPQFCHIPHQSRRSLEKSTSSATSLRCRSTFCQGHSQLQHKQFADRCAHRGSPQQESAHNRSEDWLISRPSSRVYFSDSLSTFGAVATFPLLGPRDRRDARTGHPIPAACCVSGLATNRSCRKRTVDPVRLVCPPCAQNECRLGETLEAFAPWPAPLTTVRGSAA